jgi:UDP-N-acetylmuramoyl-tripeptide--D-alanyl-D-alanine ligase
MTLAEVAAATGGQVLDAPPDVAVTAAPVLDSRLAVPGCLFIALPGEHVDGADFAAAAGAGGAVAALVDRRLGTPAVVVPNVVSGLGRLARAVLDRLPGAAVIGVTGSAGKTGTKDLIAALLTPLGPTVATAGSFNNEIGLPLTVLRAEPDTRWLVLEYSARGVGQIAALCEVAPPRIGVVLNVGSAHIGVFGSQANIAAAKGELLEALPADGLAVLNADDPWVIAMAERTRARVVSVGTVPGAEVSARSVRLNAHGQPAFRLVASGGSALVELALHGAHQVSGALAAAAVALELGRDVAEVAAGLGAAEPVSRWRMEVSEAPGAVTVINDAYNANPESTAAALRALVAIARPDGGAVRRCWAVLGVMAELGAAAPAAHREIGCLAARLGVDRVLAVGAPARGVAEAATAAGVQAAAVADTEAAIGLLRAELRPGDVVLTKASRAAGLERVAAALLAGTSDPGPKSPR